MDPLDPRTGDALRQPVDQPRPLTVLPAGWTELVDGLAHPTDIRITKHQWGAFHGTDLGGQHRAQLTQMTADKFRV